MRTNVFCRQIRNRKWFHSPEGAPSFWGDKGVRIGTGSPEGGAEPRVSSNEGRRRVSLVAQLAGLGDRTNDKVTNNQNIQNTIRWLMTNNALKLRQNCNVPQESDKKDRTLVNGQILNKTSLLKVSIEIAQKLTHLSCSLASLSPKHSKFSSLSSENSSCLRSGDVEAPIAESASVSEWGD